MGKIFGVCMIVALIYVATTIHTEGAENAFGGAFSFLASTSEAEAEEFLGQTSLYMAEEPANPRSRQVPVTQGLRDRVNRHMDTAAKRRAAAERRTRH